MRLNMTGVNMCGLQMVSNLRSLGLKSSKFSRLAGAAPRAGAAKRLKAGAAGILLLSRVSFANIGCKCCAFFGASLRELVILCTHIVINAWSHPQHMVTSLDLMVVLHV